MEPTREEWKSWAAVMSAKEEEAAMANWWLTLPMLGWNAQGAREAQQRQYEALQNSPLWHQQNALANSASTALSGLPGGFYMPDRFQLRG